MYTKCTPGIIKYRYDHSSEYNEINVFEKGRPVNLNNFSIKQLYPNILPISSKNKNSLLKLCKSKDIPEMYHVWFKSLPTSASAKDLLPEPTSEVEDDSDT